MRSTDSNDVSSDNVAPSKAPGLPPLIALQENATDDEQVAYIRAHYCAIGLCEQIRLQHAWLAGNALLQTQKRSKHTADERDAFCQKHFGIKARHARNLMRIARHFQSLDSLPEDCSINGALRIVSECEKRKEAEEAATNPATTPPPSDRNGDTNEPDGGTSDGQSDHDATTVAEPQAPPPDRGERAADLVDDIMRIVGRLDDEHLELIEKVHALLTAALGTTDAAAAQDMSATRRTRRKKGDA